MKKIYVKLVIAGKDIATVPKSYIVGVAVDVIIKGAEEGKEYIKIEDVPDKYRTATIAALEVEGYDKHGEPIE